MNKRPNSVLHMVLWGIGGGFILVPAYVVLFIDIVDLICCGGNDLNGLRLLSQPELWNWTLLFGVIPGGLIGAILGLNLWNIMRKLDKPLTRDKILDNRSEVYVSSFVFTIIISFIIVVILDEISVFSSIPPFLVAIFATYAAHRYMFRLRLWAEKSSKSKSKNTDIDVSRLAETGTDGSNQYLPSDKQSEAKS